MLAKLDQEVEEFTRRLNANWKPRTAPKPQAASAQSTSDSVAAVRSLLTSCLQSLGLADQLKVRAREGGWVDTRAVALTGVRFHAQVTATNRIANAFAPSAVDRTASVRVAGGTLSMRVVTAFVPDVKEP